jgi:hypothetical protein
MATPVQTQPLLHHEFWYCSRQYWSRAKIEMSYIFRFRLWLAFGLAGRDLKA